MNETAPLDFSIGRLGIPQYHSPMKLSHQLGDYVANFVEDSERILYHNSLTQLQEVLKSGIEPPSFEAAGPRERIFFNPEEVTAAVVTCGGLCPGLNDVIQGVVHSLTFHYGVKNILGIRYGYRGMVSSSGLEPVNLTPDAVEDIHTRGGCLLGSSRGPQPLGEMVDFLARRNVRMLFTIGGDGTQRGSLALAQEMETRNLAIAVVGIPKTIDNDIQFVEKSFGFETAYSVAVQVLRSAHAEAFGAHNGIAIVKLMGRESGFLAATASVASGEVNFALVPEVPFDLKPPNGFLAALEKRILLRHHAVVAVAEGAGQELVTTASARTATDASGNVRLGDIGGYLRERVEKHFQERGIPATVRYIDPSYIVRSLETTPADRMFCLRLAHNAVHAAMSGRTRMMVGYWNSAFTHAPIEAAVRQRKKLNPECDLWLSVLESTGQPNRMVNG